MIDDDPRSLMDMNRDLNRLEETSKTLMEATNKLYREMGNLEISLTHRLEKLEGNQERMMMHLTSLATKVQGMSNLIGELAKEQILQTQAKDNLDDRITKLEESLSKVALMLAKAEEYREMLTPLQREQMIALMPFLEAATQLSLSPPAQAAPAPTDNNAPGS